MSRKRLHEIEPWLCGKNCEGRGLTFARVTSDLLNSAPFNALSFGAQILYVRMTVRAAGKREFTFPHALYHPSFSNAAFERARNELVSAGFIEIKSSNGNLRQPNVYAFCFRWKAGL